MDRPYLSQLWGDDCLGPCTARRYGRGIVGQPGGNIALLGDVNRCAMAAAVGLLRTFVVVETEGMGRAARRQRTFGRCDTGLAATDIKLA